MIDEAVLILELALARAEAFVRDGRIEEAVRALSVATLAADLLDSQDPETER